MKISSHFCIFLLRFLALIEMEALIELCDLIAQKPAQFSEKLSWICSKCPLLDSLSSGSSRVSRSQLNAILAVARFLSKCPDCSDLRPKSVVVEFLRSIPYSFNQSYWPPSFNGDSIASFFVDFLGYVAKAAELSTEFEDEVTEFSGEVIISAISNGGELSSIAKAFLVSLSQNSLPISASDANKLVTCLIDQFAFPIPVLGTPMEQTGGNSESSSSQSSPLSLNNHSKPNSTESPGNSTSSAASKTADDASPATSRGSVMNGDRHLWLSNVDQLTANLGLNDGGVSGTSSGLQAASFEEESVGSLEKQEMAFKLIANILDKVQLDPGLLEQVGLIAKKQIQSMSVFLRVISF